MTIDAEARYFARMIGPFALNDNAGNNILPQGRKARALLAYLMLEGGEPVLRSKLMALGWSERGEEQARASLRQALYECRTLASGEDPILRIERERVFLSTDRINSDLGRILACQQIGDATGIAEAIGRSIAPLFDDLDDVDPAFDTWLAGERAHQHAVICTAIADGISAALAQGQATVARRLADLLVEDNQFDEAWAQLAMKSCHACGDRGAVHRTFERLKMTLASELGVAPSPETVSIYRALMDGESSPRSNATIVPPAASITQLGDGAGANLIASSSIGSPARHRQPKFRLHVSIAIVAAALIVSVGTWLLSSHMASTDRVIAVQSLDVRSGDAAAQVVQLGLSDDLARAMIGNPGRFSVAQVNDRDKRPQASQLVLSGNAATIGTTLHAQVQLNNVASGALLWSRDFVGVPDQAGALREQVATRIGAVLNCALSTRNQGQKPVSDDATRLYLGACDRIADYDLDGALVLLRQVTSMAPNFARAWADLSTTEAFVADDFDPAQRAAAFDRARRNAQHALAIDPKTGLAYYALAATIPGIQNWSRRMAIVTKGLAVDPESSELNNRMGEELLDVGRSTEGISYLQRSMNFDPLDPVKTLALITPLAFNDRLDEAEPLIARANRIWPGNAMIWRATFEVEARVGDPAKALAMLADPQRPELRDAGDVARWRLLLKARLEPSKTDVDAAVALIDADMRPDAIADPLIAIDDLAMLGRVDDAYRRASAVPVAPDDDSNRILFRSYAASLRADPRFMALAARRGLVAIWRATNHWPDFCSAPRAPYDCTFKAAKVESR